MSDPQAQPPGDPSYHDPNGLDPNNREPNVGQPGYGQPQYAQPPDGGPYANPVVAAPLSEADDRQWASLAHLGGILSFLPALVIWLVFKDRGRFTNTEAKEALNFQITLLIGYVAINVASFILAIVTFGIGGLLIGLAWLLWVAGVIFSIMGFLKAKDGQNYRYPFALRLIK
ncbi:DUF4870 domain-containing protein [Cryobacterium sp. PH31-O1]|uniref:DUF4870 domain-containing protein n=1 Tax=Cryobacterium sp. PH31-O1 TaxID=3046306 RepID=UPI0024BBB6DC|nr:DUF4870 domain-containing protein [Cryobacterium sp. PH31-O1]MDJ0338792.1 DUF4870 domain-containing protein [Cryobacterium sp. PH31-O1]